jgi:hypothetical protein
MVLTDDGRMIDSSPMHHRKAPAGMDSNSEPGQNETDRSVVQSLKQPSPTNATDDGIVIVLTGTQSHDCRRANQYSIDIGGVPEGRIPSKATKQYSSIFSIHSGILTSDSLPQ